MVGSRNGVKPSFARRRRPGAVPRSARIEPKAGAVEVEAEAATAVLAAMRGAVGAGRARGGSVRSHGSSSDATDVDPRERLKACCRRLVAFMCTQVGVGALVVGYAIVGAVGFMWLERGHDSPLLEQERTVIGMRAACADELWDLVDRHNTLDGAAAWARDADVVLRRFQDVVARAARAGYTGASLDNTWSFPAALMFCLSVFTMIGYGNLVPRTSWGKAVTVLYAVFGIPLYVLYFMNMGKVLATTFRWLYARVHECSRDRSPRLRRGGSVGPAPPPRRVIVPSTACLWVIAAYILAGTIMFAEWEGWNYLNSTYFCVTSLCKIGIGDFVPGANISDSHGGSQTKLVINFVYLLLGMGLVAMCYNLMREEVRVKVREVKRELGQCLEDTRTRMAYCTEPSEN
ncbi:potassium channel subfamily K member 10 [Schistocerca cancellata]|uniref:potassium channel subfamily K member 10 n=1 Tax=Schistocerca cancellata TaxID=274614 RepID=UPI002117564D|nr:potassium channel subfamily K member 10 [Schistocerca cancellata]